MDHSTTEYAEHTEKHSILTSVYCDEPAAARAQRLLQACEPVISSLTRLEFSSDVAKKLRMKTFTHTEAVRLISRFHEHIRSGIFVMTVIGEPHYAMANDWVDSFATGLRTMDALHLAVAASEDLLLATADAVLARSARSLGLKVVAV